MSTGAKEDIPRVELWVRSLYPAGVERRQEAVLARLERLAARDRIASFELLLAGEKVGLGSAAARTAVGRRTLDRFEQFRGWADRTDRSLEPVFEVRTVDSAFTGERFRTVSFPSISVAEYVDGELRHVAPHTDGDTVVTVDDRLAQLAERPRPVAGNEGVAGAVHPGDD